jgi:hypothetical protein
MLATAKLRGRPKASEYQTIVERLLVAEVIIQVR